MSNKKQGFLNCLDTLNHTKAEAPDAITKNEEVDVDNTNVKWLMREREFAENLLCKRFNFLLMFFSITIAGAIASLEFNIVISIIVLGIGFIINFPVTLTIIRLQKKVDVLLDLLPENHPVKITNKMLAGKSRRKIIGIYIPKLCTVLLILLFCSAFIACIFKIPIINKP